MAKTLAPLVWDFNRQIGSDTAAHVGGTGHYYDQTAQALFLNGGLKTRLCTPAAGHWRDAVLSDPSQFIDTVAYTRMTMDHPVNGTVYFAAVVGGVLRFMRYQYAADIGNITEQVTYTAQADNPITQISANVKNTSNDWFDGDATLFNPGARITLGVAFGEGDVYPIGVALLDDISHDPQATTVPISGRNNIGYYLKALSGMRRATRPASTASLSSAFANMRGSENTTSCPVVARSRLRSSRLTQCSRPSTSCTTTSITSPASQWPSPRRRTAQSSPGTVAGWTPICRRAITPLY